MRAAIPSRSSLLTLLACLPAACGGGDGGQGAAAGPDMGQEPEPAASPAPATWAGSETCRECHAQAFGSWADSHHALAERPLDPDLDRQAFEPERELSFGGLSSKARVRSGRMELVTQGIDGPAQVFEVQRVFGVEPLRQYVIAAERGRFQVSELAHDPATGDWFNVYGEESRRPGEWGHWTGRGMTWNAMCAACHTTRLRKGYDAQEDAYDTRYLELGVGCEACHGPLGEHVAWQTERGGAAQGDPTVSRLDRSAVMETCGACHSRRSELTGAPVPGEAFLDHHLPVIPDGSGIYHPDGQVHEEDFEYVSFLSSRMHGEGVTCLDCHGPHDGELVQTGNALCLQCHVGKIEPGPHSGHEPGTPGGNCVDCHMPLTTYMQRHARRDHGFTIPDPLLTREHGVPNACARCHEDRGLDWQVSAAEQLFGERLERPTRARARAVARARAGDPGALDALVASLGGEQPLWRAVAAALLGEWLDEPGVADRLLQASEDDSALVRSKVQAAMGPLVEYGWPPAIESARRGLEDPLRAVRVEAAWSLRAELDEDSPVAGELLEFLRHNQDEPLGAHRLAAWHLARGEAGAAVPLLEKAVAWDPLTALFRHDLAAALAAAGDPKAAAAVLSEACGDFPNDGVLMHALGLARGELGDLPGAVDAFERAVGVEPDLGRAWYNLGLGRVALGRVQEALDALEQAELRSPSSPDPAFAAATILRDAGRSKEALEAALRALQRDPRNSQATALVRELQAGSER